MGWFSEITLVVGSADIAGDLVDVSAKAAMLLFAALAATYFLRRASASTRHQVWTVALVAVLALPALTMALPSLQVPIIAVGPRNDRRSQRRCAPYSGRSSTKAPTCDALMEALEDEDVDVRKQALWALMRGVDADDPEFDYEALADTLRRALAGGQGSR